MGGKMQGIIVVNKEKEYTSRDVVNKLQGILKTRKIGHTGTLDPLAEGVLVICIGKYTKLVNEITSYDKEYIAEVKLGILTDTLDITGNILEEKSYHIDEVQIIDVLNSFKGIQMQEVPKYSAVKINGKKLYEYARNNIDITLPKREVNISEIELLNIYEDGFKFKVKVSKGTYIRSLINDICKKLGTVGTMKNLVRTKQGKFNISDSFTLKEIEENNFKLLEIKDVLNYNTIKLDDDTYFKVKNGAKIEMNIENKKYFMEYKKNIIAIYEFQDNIGKINIMM